MSDWLIKNRGHWPERKADKRRWADVVRETDGSTQCVPYPGWKLIGDRLAQKKGGR